MKKSILLCILILTSLIGHGQNTYPTAVNTTAGLGTGSAILPTSPTLRLKVTSGTAGNSGIQLTNVTSSTATTGSNGKVLSVDTSGNIILTPDTNIYNTSGTLTGARTVNLNNNNLNFNSATPGGNLLINGSNGNVGIGNSAPTAKLDVSGALKANLGTFTTSLPDGQTFASIADRNEKCLAFGAGYTIGTGLGYNYSRMLNFLDFPVSNYNTKSALYFGIEDRNDFGRYRFAAETGGNTQMIMLNRLQQEVMKVYEDGSDNVKMTMPMPNSYLCIGTVNSVDGAEVYKLSVKGKIRAEEVRVYNTWADYVFENDYNLKTLNEVEEFINKNGHLPNVPSAEVVEKDGLKLGEMSKIQQEKIEELTLYLIQQNKEIQELKAQVKALIERN